MVQRKEREREKRVLIKRLPQQNWVNPNNVSRAYSTSITAYIYPVDCEDTLYMFVHYFTPALSLCFLYLPAHKSFKVLSLSLHSVYPATTHPLPPSYFPPTSYSSWAITGIINLRLQLLPTMAGLQSCATHCAGPTEQTVNSAVAAVVIDKKSSNSFSLHCLSDS